MFLLPYREAEKKFPEFDYFELSISIALQNECYHFD